MMIFNNFNKVFLKYFLLVVLVVVINNSCSKKDDPIIPDNNLIMAEKTDVKTFEITNLIVKGTLLGKYSGTFGNVPIELLKTSDSTLTFYVPDVTIGDQLLKFELGKINFKVTKTALVDADQMATTIFNNFDKQVAALNPTTAEEIAEVDSMNKLKQEVLELFNTLTVDQKKQTALFYEANKEIFKSFSLNVNSNLNAPTIFRSQSDCPRTDFKSFYGCTAENLANASIDLKNSSIEFLKMMGMAGSMAGIAYNTSVLGPVAWGITAVGISLPLGMAGYLLITEVKPAAVKFKNALIPFINANWIFSKGLFITVTKQFASESNTDLQLDSKFHSISTVDADVNYGTGFFINSMASLSVYWNKLTAVFGIMPTYKNNEGPATLISGDISISNISNSNVQLISQSGEQVKFKSLSGNEETFNYHIKVVKEGFVEEETLNAKVLAVTDSTEIYKASAIGKYLITPSDPANSRTYCELLADGAAKYTVFDNPSWSDGTVFNARWNIVKQNGRYYYWETGFWHPGFPNIEINSPLTYPVTGFNFHNNTSYSK